MSDDAFESQSREIDASRPSAARLYHYYLSGEAVFEIDRIFAERLFEIAPYADLYAHNNRNFLRRAVKYMVGQGIRQFLDIGSGLPTVGNTHEVARSLAPDARVVYVDNDLEAVNRSHELLSEQGALDTTAVFDADLRRPESVLDHPTTLELLDFEQPIGLLIVSVWPFVPEEYQPRKVMATLRDRLPSGSYVAMTHATTDGLDEETVERGEEVTDLYSKTSDPLTYRSRAEFGALFDGFDFVEPGMVYAPAWRPEGPVDTDDASYLSNLAAVGYKP
ncbi:SAM-dependent methyltransferase [Nocardia sp. alder85J]|uniref:SAM-dependent methyltransferase n=1 Tax=Nocardia sp. alder85J TaxID=2862949 RepID=UPI001CD24D96|nr:SAM-dependent methyltransferase [Nocardia sp. alder85J]MCX4094923.1 SAM-dependent methyltransferase [Nocardia sp. alder85J]